MIYFENKWHLSYSQSQHRNWKTPCENHVQQSIQISAKTLLSVCLAESKRSSRHKVETCISMYSDQLFQTFFIQIGRDSVFFSQQHLEK